MTDKKWLFASDIHFPRHDSRMVSLWFDVLRYLKPQAVDLLGDIDDADTTSRWAEGTSRAAGSIEDGGVSDTRKFLADIHAVVPKSDKHFHDGNHGWYRHQKYLDKNAPTVLDYITPNTLYDYEKSGFDWHLYDQPPVKRYGDIYAHHGESISKHSGESVRNDVVSWGVSLIRGHCFSSDTELLTDRGWKSYTEISIGDMAYTLNRETGLGEFQPIEEKFVYDNFDSMVSVKSATLDLLVTGGHGLVNKVANTFEEITAGDLANRNKTVIPQGVESGMSEVYDDSKIKMAARAVAEGNLDSYSTKTFSSEMINVLSSRQARLLLEEYVWLDGCKNLSVFNSYQLASNNQTVVDQLMQIAIMAGYGVTVSGPRNGVYHVTFNTSGQAEVQKNHVSQVEYSGDVWCVTVPNHTLVVRRNGKSAVTMNSHRQGEYHVSYPLAGRELRGFEIGHMCDPKQMTYDVAPNWQAGFAYGLVHGDDVFIDTVQIINYNCYVAGKLFKG